MRAAPPAPRGEVARLGRGYRLFLDGDYAAARRTLRPLADSTRLHNRDYALYLLAQSELLSGQAGQAVRDFERVEKLGGRFVVLARWRAADALWTAGRTEEARRAYEAALPSASDAVAPAVARFRIAEALAGRSTTQAMAMYRQVYVDSPLHPLAERALARLKALGAPPITAVEHVERAKIMSADREWQRAVDELAEVAVEAPQAIRDEAEYWLGTTYFHMRHNYEQAAAKLLEVWPRLKGDERKSDALFHGARARSRSDRDDDAIVGYRKVVAQFPHARLAPEASFLTGWLDFNRGHYKDAIPSLKETLRRYGSSSFEDDARWYLGFSRWLEGDYAGALSDFDALAGHPGALVGGKGAYWKGRALAQLGRLDQATAVWQALVNQYPFTYYAQVARLRLRQHGVELGPFGDGPSRRQPPSLQALDSGLERDPLIARVDELLAAGMTVEAGVELRRGESAFLHHYGAARALPMLFDRYVRADNFNRPHVLAESYAGAALRLDPQADPTVRAWWVELEPRAYRKYIEKYSPTGDDPPYYLYTIMQKESAYNPHDVSYADAIGLLQMIPPTSRKVGLRIGTPYTDDVLYDPEGNIEFGAWYIGHLLSKFKGQIALGAGSYNAGPKAMMKWVKLNGQHPLDEFIELCPYTQTREYMKKVLGIYSRYLWLYEKRDYLPDLHVDPNYVDNDIDY